MHFDCLDDIYATVKSNLHFGKVSQTGLTSPCIPVRPVHPVVSILIVNICPHVFFKACMPKNNLLDQNCLMMMTNNTSAIYYF
jgi:hypothetical protein